MRILSSKVINQILAFLFLSISLHAASFERLIYLVDRPDTYEHLLRNIESFDIIAPQVFFFNRDGALYGELDERIITLAKSHKKKLMPLVINKDFNQEEVQQFLKNEEAKARLITALQKVGSKHGFMGWQLDFEHMGLESRAPYVEFVKKLHLHLQKYRMQLSIAVVPPRYHELLNAHDAQFHSDWVMAYDFKLLSKHSDFLSVMAYDQHTSSTPPGAVASYDWVERVIKEMLKEVSRDKISLGIPLYSRLWFAGMKGDSPSVQTRSFTYHGARDWSARRDMVLIWSDSEHVWWGFCEHGGVREYLFLEDVDSFNAKLSLAKRYKLRGVSLWRLGQEDVGIYEKLQK